MSGKSKTNSSSRGYHVLVGRTKNGWEFVFGSYDSNDSELKRTGSKEHRSPSGGYPYSKLKVLDLPDASQAAVDAAISAIEESTSSSRGIVEVRKVRGRKRNPRLLQISGLVRIPTGVSTNPVGAGS